MRSAAAGCDWRLRKRGQVEVSCVREIASDRRIDVVPPPYYISIPVARRMSILTSKLLKLVIARLPTR